MLQPGAKRTYLCIAWLFISLFAHLSFDLASAPSPQRGKESYADHYQKWLERDVVYIITDEERDVFQKLITPEEKDAFIEQFWLRREKANPGANFKEEHYRRIAYANERFASGYEGWATDRGRTYIKFGPPKSIDRNPTGNVYSRSAAEGGGDTMYYPNETWYYDRIEGIGDGIRLEFVDPSFTGEYHLARDPYEKDALLDKPGQGMTYAEQQGLSSKRNRIDAMFMGRTSTADGNTMNDVSRQPFDSLLQYFALRRPPEFRFNELREKVSARISFPNNSSMKVEFAYQILYLDAMHCLVPASFSVPLVHLTRKANDIGLHIAHISIYGKVTDLSEHVQYEFEDTLSQDIPLNESEGAVYLYEKKLPLKPGRYKLTAILMNEESSETTVLEKLLNIPSMEQGLSLSSINLLSSYFKGITNTSLTEPFVIPGGIKAYPLYQDINKKKQYAVGIHFEIYQPAFAQDTGLPQVGANVTVFNQEGKAVIQESLPRSALRLVGTRVVVLHKMNFAALPAGRYRLQASVYDALVDKEIARSIDISLAEP